MQGRHWRPPAWGPCCRPPLADPAWRARLCEALTAHGVSLVSADELAHETEQKDREQTGLPPGGWLPKCSAAAGCTAVEQQEGTPGCSAMPVAAPNCALLPAAEHLPAAGATKRVLPICLEVTTPDLHYVRVHRRHGTTDRCACGRAGGWVQTVRAPCRLPMLGVILAAVPQVEPKSLPLHFISIAGCCRRRRLQHGAPGCSSWRPACLAESISCGGPTGRTRPW